MTTSFRVDIRAYEHAETGLLKQCVHNPAALQHPHDAALHPPNPMIDSAFLEEDEEEDEEDFLSKPEVVQLIEDVVKAVQLDTHPNALEIVHDSAAGSNYEDQDQPVPLSSAQQLETVTILTRGSQTIDPEEPQRSINNGTLSPTQPESGNAFPYLSEYFDQDPEPAYYEHQLQPDYTNCHFPS